MNRFGVACWSHFNMLTCSSFESDARFLWGSCRTFFGEPCINAPPVVPVPPGYGGTPIRYP